MQNTDITYVTSKRGLFNINFKELWKYRDLIVLFVKRDLKSAYKQTVLGPIWIIINPLLSTSIFTIVFGLPEPRVLDLSRQRAAFRQGIFSEARRSYRRYRL